MPCCAMSPARGTWVSAHPDVILKMGVKEVLYRTRHLGWGADTHRYDSAASFRSEFPQRLRSGGPRVLKQNFAAMAAKAFGRSRRWRTTWSACFTRCAAVSPKNFRSTRVYRTLRTAISAGAAASSTSRFSLACPNGMIRCFMSGSKVAGLRAPTDQGFDPAAAGGPDAPEAQPGPRIMHSPAPAFQALRQVDGGRLDTGDDGSAWPRRGVAAGDLGC